MLEYMEVIMAKNITVLNLYEARDVGDGAV